MSYYSIHCFSFDKSASAGMLSGASPAGAKKLKPAFVKSVANISDAEIVSSSLKHADKKVEKSMPARLFNAMIPLTALVIPLAFGITTKGKVAPVKIDDKLVEKSTALSSKVMAGLSSAGLIVGAGALFNGVDNIKERIFNSSEKVNRFEENHPLVSKAGDFALKGAILAGSLLAATKGKNYLAEKFQPSANALQKAKADVFEKIDSTKFAEKVTNASKGYAEFAKKHPKVSNFVDNNAFLGAAVAWFGTMGALNASVGIKKERVAIETAEELVVAREIARNI